MKPTKDIKQCPLYGGRYYADALGNIYLDESGEQQVGVYANTSGHLMTTTTPQALVHRIVYYAFNPDAPVKGYDIHDSRGKEAHDFNRGRNCLQHLVIHV